MYNQIMIIGDFNGVSKPQVDKVPYKKGEKLPFFFLNGATRKSGGYLETI